MRLEGVVSVATSYIPGSFLEKIKIEIVAMNLNDLYKKVSVIPIGDFPSICVVRLIAWVYLNLFHRAEVNPWLEDVYGSQWDIHERIREIAGELADLIKIRL